MALTGESSRKLSSYDLKATDTERERRNFPGYEKKQYYNLADMQAWNQQGTTDTDTFTEGNAHKPHGGGYAKVYEKKGSTGRTNGMDPHTKEN